MKSNFWKKLSNPILALAPMAGYSDQAFRQICKSFGAQVLYSEMASVAALYYAKDKKHNPTMELLRFNRKKERYYVVQLFGSEPKHFAFASKLVTEIIKPDGLDINFGCPAPKVLKQGAGAKLFSDVGKSRQVIQAVLENTSLPVSIKVRTEAFGVKLGSFLKNISDLDIKALTIHARSLAGAFKAEPDWKIVKKMRPYFSGKILINGGIFKHRDINKALKSSGADGVAIARGACGNPWVFKKEKPQEPKKVLAIVRKHVKLVREYKFKEFRTHLVAYICGLENISLWRSQLLKTESRPELFQILKEYEKSLKNKD